MFSVQSARPLTGGEVADGGWELRRENKVATRRRGKAKPRETASARRKREEQERLDAEEAADYRRVWDLGNELFYKGNFQEAAARYIEAMQKNPNEPGVLRNRAQCHILLGALAEGLEDAEKCIELDPTYLKGYVCKAKVQALMHTYESAMATYIEGLKWDPNDHVLTDGFKRCMTCIQRSKGGEVGREDLNDNLRHWHSDIALCTELQKNMEEVAVLKKEVSDERLRRIESERKERISEEQLSESKRRHIEELQKANEHSKNVEHQLSESKKRHIEELQKANEHGGNVQHQLLESKERYNQLQAKHDLLLKERDNALKDVKKLSQGTSTAMPCQFSFAELERATKNFRASLKIRECGFISVYEGVLRNTKVLIKVLKHDDLQGSRFAQEVAIHGRVRHANLVALLGACSESSTLVYELLPNGSLEDFLSCAVKRRTLTWQIRVRIIAEICSALIFLHENKPDPIVHGDLKPANILLDANLVSKLSDFGISQLLIKNKSNKQPVEDPTYMDPEYLTTRKITPQSDVYSFGIMVFCLLTGKPPTGIRKIVEDAIDLKSVVDTSAGEWPEGHIYQLRDLSLSCTKQSSRSRPVLSGQLWTLVEAMRDYEMSSSPPSSSSVRDGSSTPSHFKCSITHDIMKDPHFAADGYTYEGEAIQEWLLRKNTSPLTGLPLPHRELIQNHSMRSAIMEWLQQHKTPQL